MLLNDLLIALIRTNKNNFNSHVKIDFDRAKQVVRFSAPIFRHAASLPYSVQNYVKMREGIAFCPHRTTLQWQDSDQVCLVQEIPFQGDFQSTVRRQMIDFRRLAARYRRTIGVIAIEEIRGI